MDPNEPQEVTNEPRYKRFKKCLTSEGEERRRRISRRRKLAGRSLLSAFLPFGVFSKVEIVAIYRH